MSALSTSQAVAKLLARQAQQPWLFSEGSNNPLLVVNPDGTSLNSLSDDAWCFHAGHSQHWRNGFCQATAPALDKYQGILLVVAKEQPLNQWILSQLAQAPKDTPIWLVGEKRGGITSLVKKLPSAYATPQKVASGNHCQLYLSSVAAPQPATALTDVVSQTDMTAAGLNATINSLPGVFSRERLDKGTELLLNTLPSTLPSPVFDFACGNGVISVFIGQRQEPVIAVSDVNPLAIEAAKLNLPNSVDTYLCDGFPQGVEGLGTIVTNPPFHTGLHTDYDIVPEFLRRAHAALRKNGQLYLVANRFLPWPEAINQYFGQHKVLADDGKFRVYFAKK